MEVVGIGQNALDSQYFIHFTSLIQDAWVTRYLGTFYAAFLLKEKISEMMGIEPGTLGF